MSDISSDFSINSDIYYLNHAAVSPWPVRTGQIIKDFADENIHMGAKHYPRWMTVEQDLRENICQLINAPSSDDIALVKNTSEALSMVAYGLNWTPGDNIVIAEQEFPSNRIVWQSLQAQGVTVKFVDLYQNMHAGNTPEDNLLAAIDEKTRLLSVSSVQYGDGLRMDLKKLGEFCRQQQVLFCVDAIQSIGALTFDVQDIHKKNIQGNQKAFHKLLIHPCL